MQPAWSSAPLSERSVDLKLLRLGGGAQEPELQNCQA